jgi:hypothetical protein
VAETNLRRGVEVTLHLMQAANKTLAGWMAASVIGAGMLVGGAKLGADDKPEAGNVASKLKECDLGEAGKGLIYDGLCLSAPPFGWISDSESADSTP